MTFVAEIARPASHRYTLVRVTPARYVVDDLALVSGRYEMDFAYPIARVERNGVALTEDASANPSTNDHWYHDESTGLLQVKLASAPSATTNVIVVFYHVFFGSNGVATHEDPLDDSTPLRQWNPALLYEPTFTQGLSDLFFGVFTVESSTIVLANDAFEFQEYLTANDSFFNKRIDVWVVVNDQVAKVFAGLVTRIAVDSNEVAITVRDDFERLRQTALMGDALDEAYLLTSAYADMDPAFNFRPVKYVFGNSCHDFRTGRSPFGIRNAAQNLSVLDFERCEVATFVGPYEEPFEDANRGPYVLCRTGSAGLKTLDFGSPTSVVLARGDVAGTRYFYLQSYRCRLRFSYAAGGHNLQVGDSFKWSHASVNAGADQYAVVMSVSATVVDCMVLSRNATTVGANVTVTAGTFHTNSAPAIAIKWSSPSGIDTSGGDGNVQVAVLAYELDFTVAETTLASGNKSYAITLVDAFEFNTNHDSLPFHATGSVFDPSCVVYFRASTDPDSNATRHDQVLKTILEAAGLTCNAASFTAAGGTLASKASFTIPAFDESSPGTYLDYVETVLTSTLGYCKVNSDDEVEYALVAAPSSSDATTEDELIGFPSLEVDYDDIVTSVVFQNSHVPPSDTYHFDGAHSQAENVKARYLHGVEKTLIVEHVLDDDARQSVIMAARASRSAVYSFKVATKLLTAEIGDDLQLETSAILGGSGADDVKLTTIVKSAEVVAVTATDLEGI